MDDTTPLTQLLELIDVEEHELEEHQEAERAEVALLELYHNHEDGFEALKARWEYYEGKLEEAVEEQQDLVERHRAACAAVRSAKYLVEKHEPSAPCWGVGGFTVFGHWRHEIPSHIREWCSRDGECSPAHWQREEAHVVAMTEEWNEVFRVSEQVPLGKLLRQAEDERKGLADELEPPDASTVKNAVWFVVCDELVEKAATNSIPIQDEETQKAAEQSEPGRPKRIENPEEVLETLNVVCEWLTTDPPNVFKGEGGLVNFASEEFPYSAQSTVRDRIRFTFEQLAQKYPDLPTPEFSTGTDGREYVENEAQIRELRDEYEARFVEK